MLPTAYVAVGGGDHSPMSYSHARAAASLAQLSSGVRHGVHTPSEDRFDGSGTVHKPQRTVNATNFVVPKKLTSIKFSVLPGAQL